MSCKRFARNDFSGVPKFPVTQQNRRSGTTPGARHQGRQPQAAVLRSRSPQGETYGEKSNRGSALSFKCLLVIHITTRRLALLEIKIPFRVALVVPSQP